ncbi:hypothetical protein BDZ90DRAFT_230608 [Jaminaea rosea]|uniref:Uncharacterized protein n=1 Tax=Jaminaea rosea TaxID=1569628 RepID=A0A316UWU7_9BASI|nr:hypothetical protein BDZ90DRAFT_230608 [Jaminaea rosea]PWN29759.1 hypothetical protein BDZ90DRAFT_230608 [Jaminaea rosea]
MLRGDSAIAVTLAGTGWESGLADFREARHVKAQQTNAASSRKHLTSFKRRLMHFDLGARENSDGSGGCNGTQAGLSDAKLLNIQAEMGAPQPVHQH